MSPAGALSLAALCVACLVAVGGWFALCSWLTERLWPRVGPAADGWEASRRRDRWFRRLVVGGLAATFGVPALLFFAERDGWWGQLRAWREREPAPPAVRPHDLRPEADVSPVRTW